MFYTHPDTFTKDLELIEKYGGFNENDWIEGHSLKVGNFVQKKKARVLRYVDGDWILGKISDSEYKELAGKEVHKALELERSRFHADSETYRENARKALLMNVQL